MTTLRLSRLHVVAGLREEAGPRVGQQMFRGVVDAPIDSRRRHAVPEPPKRQAFGPLISVMHIDLSQDELSPF